MNRPLAVKSRLAKLRALMRASRVDGFIVPQTDPHLSEYAAPRYNALTFLTGFKSSNAALAVTQGEAALLTDGRYITSANRAFRGTCVSPVLTGARATVFTAGVSWLSERLRENGVIGFSGDLCSMSDYEKAGAIARKRGIKLKTKLDLTQKLWKSRPALPRTPLYAIYAPQKLRVSEKLRRAREAMARFGADYYFTGDLCSVAYLTNLRGSDVPHTPVFYAYMLIGAKSARLFARSETTPPGVKRRLEKQGVTTREYGDVARYIKKIPKNASVAYAPEKTNAELALLLEKTARAIKRPDIAAQIKAVKTDYEIKNVKKAFLRDSVHFTKTLKTVSDRVKDGARVLTERDVSLTLEGFRRADGRYLFPSFSSIVAFGENAAQMHYAFRGAGGAVLKNGLLLIDAGGQYRYGTTDITRTVTTGAVPAEMKHDFTLVLKAHIALASQIFPRGVTGAQLDAIARAPVWNKGLDYKSGTGHGVGFCLSVHEGPFGVSKTQSRHPLKPGMIITIEPGVYKEGEYGVRIENAYVVKKAFKNETAVFLRFEPLSFCPVDLAAINADMLTSGEKAFLNNYHKTVFERVSKRLSGAGREWLRAATAPI